MKAGERGSRLPRCARRCRPDAARRRLVILERLRSSSGNSADTYVGSDDAPPFIKHSGSVSRGAHASRQRGPRVMAPPRSGVIATLRSSPLIARVQASCPAPRNLVLLPDPSLVRKPDLYPVAIDPLVARDRVQALGKGLWDGPPLLLRRRYAAGLTLRERSGRWRLRCLGLILARTAAASQGWTERVASSCGDASLGRASSVLPERCRPA